MSASSKDITDAVNTLGEALKALREAISVTRSLWGYTKRRRDRQTAANIYEIAFKPGGMLELLEQVANGTETSETIEL